MARGKGSAASTAHALARRLRGKRMRLNKEVLERDDEIGWWRQRITLPPCDAVVGHLHRDGAHQWRKQNRDANNQDLAGFRVCWGDADEIALRKSLLAAAALHLAIPSMRFGVWLALRLAARVLRLGPRHGRRQARLAATFSAR